MSQAKEEDAPLRPEEEAALLAALEAALRPAALTPETNERLLQMALEDPLAPPSDEELIESTRLRDALASATPHEDVDLLGALSAPFGPTGVADEASAVQRAVDAALPPAPAVEPRKRTNVVYVMFGGASAVLAAAAAVALLVGLGRSSAPASEVNALIRPHSTAPLFAEHFATGDTTARMDLIASTRGRDLRDNRYAAWGVR